MSSPLTTTTALLDALWLSPNALVHWATIAIVVYTLHTLWYHFTLRADFAGAVVLITGGGSGV
jgi:hypothetical protein